MKTIDIFTDRYKSYENKDYSKCKLYAELIAKNDSIKKPILRGVYSVFKIEEIIKPFFMKTGVFPFYKSIKNDKIYMSSKGIPRALSKLGIKESCFIYNEGTFIFLLLNGSIIDLYQLSHEVMHAYAYNKGLKQDNLVEVLPMLSELLLSKYLLKCDDSIKVNPDEIKKYMLHREYEMNSLSRLLKLEFELIDELNKNGCINESKFLDDKTRYDFNKIIDFIFSNGCFMHEKYDKYIYGYIISNYLFETNKKLKCFDELIELLNNCNLESFDNICDKKLVLSR